MIFIAKSMAVMKQTFHSALRIIVPVSIALAVILMTIAGFFVHWLMNRIAHVTDTLKDMETGEADFTKRVKLLLRDEIGFLVIHFDNFCDKLQNIVR